MCEKICSVSEICKLGCNLGIHSMFSEYWYRVVCNSLMQQWGEDVFGNIGVFMFTKGTGQSLDDY